MFLIIKDSECNDRAGRDYNLRDQFIKNKNFVFINSYLIPSACQLLFVNYIRLPSNAPDMVQN